MVIAPFVEWFKTVRESSLWILLVLRAICSTISFSLPLADRIDYQQGPLQKEPVTVPCIERFEIDVNMELQCELYNSYYSSMMKGAMTSSFRTAPFTKPSTSKTFTEI